MPDTASVRVGIVGAGMAGRVHADAVRRSGARLVGLTASTPERTEAVTAHFAPERSFARSEDLVTSDDIDVIHICTPNHLHAPLAELAIAAGKHVICEKPLATDTATAERVEAAARQAGVVAAVPFVYRYHPIAWEAHERIRARQLGPIHMIHGSYLQDWLATSADTSWRVSEEQGGRSRAFADIGSHWCDLVEWVTGHRISELAASVDVVVPHRVATTPPATDGAGDARLAVHTEDCASLVFRTDQGATGTLAISQVALGRKNRLWFEIDGSEASLAFNQEQPESLWLGRRASNELLLRDPTVLSSGAARLAGLPAGHPQGYADCVFAFVTDVYAAIGGQPHEPFPTFGDAVRTARITDAVLDAAAKRSWIEVPA